MSLIARSKQPVQMDTELTHRSSRTTQVEQTETAVQDLFVQIAANYAVPLKNFIFELRCGTVTGNEIELLPPHTSQHSQRC